MQSKRRLGAGARWSITSRCLVLAVPLLAATLFLAGCGSGSGGAGGGGGASPGVSPGSTLDGTSWRLTGWSVSSLDPADFTITAQFADGKIAGKSAVNQYGGPYTAGPGAAFSTGDLATTMMAGPEPEMRAETAYLALLAKATSYKLEGATLTLADAGGNESLIYTAAK
jgi:heat shock protein HslJ